MAAGTGEFFGPGGALHGAVAAAEDGAEVGGDEGDEEGYFAEEGLEDGQAAADDGEVDFDDPVLVMSWGGWRDISWGEQWDGDGVIERARERE